MSVIVVPLVLQRSRDEMLHVLVLHFPVSAMLHFPVSALLPAPWICASRHSAVGAVMLENEPPAAWRPSISNSLLPCTAEEKEAMTEIGGDFANVYGELTDLGFARLAERLHLGPDDVFVDCGSGQGSIVLQAAREFGVRRSYGLEFAASRHRRAVARLEVEAGDPASDVAKRVQLIQGDCADAERWAAGGELSTCTCMYTCNVLFDAALNARLKQCVERCDTIRCVAAFQPWPEGLDGFREPYEVLCCETSWAPMKSTQVWDASLDRWVDDGGTAVYVYERGGPTLLQRVTSPEVNFVVLALTLARVVWLWLDSPGSSPWTE